MQTHIAYLSLEQKARPIGVRIVEPPADTRQAVRGRLYAIVELAGNQPEDAQLVEKALSVIQRTYYSVKGTQTFVLTEALREALNLFQEGAPVAQPTQPSAPGILLLSLIDNRMVLIGAGPALALITTGSNVDVYPPYVPGVNRDLQSAVEIHRQDLAMGGAFLMAGQRCLQHFTLRELASIVAYVTEDNVASVAETLRSQAGADALTGLITVVTPEDLNAPSTASPQPSLPPKRRSGLPGALSTPPPVRELSSRHALPSAMESQSQQRPDPAVDYDAESDDPALVGYAGEGWSEASSPNQPAQADKGGRVAGSSNTAASAIVPELADGLKRTLAQAGSFLRGFFPVDATNAPTAAPPVGNRRTEDTAEDDDRAGLPERQIEQRPFETHSDHYVTDATTPNQPSLRADSAQYAVPLDDEQSFDYARADVFADPLSDDMDQEENGYDQRPVPAPVPRASGPRAAHVAAARPLIGHNRISGRRARLFALAALLILLLTVVIVASVSWVTGNRNVAEAERTLDMAEASFLGAQNALDTDDKSTARLRLIEAQDLINQATILVGSRLERADRLNNQIEQELAGLLQIYPLHALTVPLVQFPPEAQPQRVIVSDQDIYVLDTGRQLIQHFELDPTRNLVLNTTGETVLAQGDNIDGVTVGRLVDITWLPPIAGVDDKAYLLVLDGTNNLFRYDRRVEGASRVDLGGRTDLLNPVQLRVYGDRLYLADAGSNQLYRYARGNFTEPPERWFGPQTQSNLGSLRSMAIDGDIWLLYEQGLLLRYRTGDQMQFSLETSFGQINDPVDLAVGDQGNSMVYIADSAEERILVFNKDGQYERQLRAPEGDVLRNLRGISVDEVAGTMYILTQSFLFNHPLPN